MLRSDPPSRLFVKPLDPVIYSVAQFCAAHHISRSKFYLLIGAGEAPARIRVGRRVLISDEAAQAWRRALEAQAAREGRP